ncbi:uncharacterized protein LOC125273938 [Megalobrama amblycephala]|uniref:uncharacterized protein LOC125273938 n=1 Tax=Megalobrama amblycephala TaxID=75352 RepID=UPI0020147172|nr:uncharacterized protein LOC125273938 [Megalobrama amblycephala]
MNRINQFCGQIQTAGGFEYKLPSDILKQTLNGDCDQSWYTKDGRLLADPSDPHTLSDPVISVSSDRLVTSDCVDQLHHGIQCDVNGSYYRHQTRFRAFSFEKNIADISVSCGEIQTAGGFEYRLQSNLLNRTLNGDCEQSWYSEDGRLLADPSYPHTLMYPATSVSSDRLVTSHCVKLNHEIICDETKLRLDIMFRVRNETAVTPNSDVLDEVTPSLQLSDQLWWLFALFIIIFIIFICFMLRKRIFRQMHGSSVNVKMIQNRDLVKVGSADPRSQQESETIQCPDDDQHH